MKRVADHREQVFVRDAAALRGWLEANHARSTGVWIVTKKKEAGGPLRWSEVVDELLCFGWIDSLPRSLDDERSMLLCAPRKPKSAWSGVNKAKVERLTTEGRMHPAGLAAVEGAKRSGTWHLLDEATKLEVPADLDAVFDAKGRAHFDAFPPSARRAILEWIAQAKTPETRAKRIAETARCARDNVRANQWRQPATKK